MLKYPNFSKKDQNCLLEKIGRKKTRMCPDALVQKVVDKMLGKYNKAVIKICDQLAKVHRNLKAPLRYLSP